MSGDSTQIHADLPDAGDPAPQPLQFGLRTLLTVVTLISALFALATRVSVLWGAVLVWMALLVAAHVVANALGTRAALRATRKPSANDDSRRLTPLELRRANAPTTRLGSNAELGVGMALFILAGGIVGSITGTAIIWRHNQGLDWGALTLASASSAVIGGFLAFLSGTFLNATLRALHEASRHARR